MASMIEKRIHRNRVQRFMRWCNLGETKGFTLIEVLVALSIFGMIAIVFAGALGVGVKATIISDERTIADSLVRSQLEEIKDATYIIVNVTSHDIYPPMVNGFAADGYEVHHDITPMWRLSDGTLIAADTEPPNSEAKADIQQITVMITRNSPERIQRTGTAEVVRVSTYKVTL